MRSTTKHSIKDGATITTDVSIDQDQTFLVSLKGAIKLTGGKGQAISLSFESIRDALTHKCDCCELRKEVEALKSLLGKSECIPQAVDQIDHLPRPSSPDLKQATEPEQTKILKQCTTAHENMLIAEVQNNDILPQELALQSAHCISNALQEPEERLQSKVSDDCEVQQLAQVAVIEQKITREQPKQRGRKRNVLAFHE